jgi:hypothetical protein
MRNLNLRVALVIYGAIHIVQGIFLIVTPGRSVVFFDFDVLGNVVYLLGVIGAAFVAAGVWFAMTGLDPLKNINGVRFAVLWAGLILAVQLYSLAKGSVDFGQIWPGILLNAAFTAAFLLFYPYRRE